VKDGDRTLDELAPLKSGQRELLYGLGQDRTIGAQADSPSQTLGVQAFEDLLQHRAFERCVHIEHRSNRKVGLTGILTDEAYI
jgi:hypothetical protein